MSIEQLFVIHYDRVISHSTEIEEFDNAADAVAWIEKSMAEANKNLYHDTPPISVDEYQVIQGRKMRLVAVECAVKVLIGNN